MFYMNPNNKPKNIHELYQAENTIKCKYFPLDRISLKGYFRTVFIIEPYM